MSATACLIESAAAANVTRRLFKTSWSKVSRTVNVLARVSADRFCSPIGHRDTSWGSNRGPSSAPDPAEEGRDERESSPTSHDAAAGAQGYSSRDPDA